MPVLGSGHPQADILLLKHAPMPPEIEEGVAFYGRAGTALMKSLKRLDIDPLVVYGTLCVKCPVADPMLAAPECIARLIEEIAIVQPKIIVIMGTDALDILNELQLPLAREVFESPGVVQRLTPSIEALYVPDIDRSLDEESAKRIVRIGLAQFFMVQTPAPCLALYRHVKCAEHPVEQIARAGHVDIAVLRFGTVMDLVHDR